MKLGTTVNVGEISGGIGANTISPRVYIKKLKLDMRGIVKEIDFSKALKKIL